jgi:hypothetical protein
MNYHRFLTTCLTIIYASPATADLGIILPVYTETSAQYNAGYAAVAKVPFIAIINPDDGPGTSRVSSLRTFANNIRNAGGRVMGYINSFYGGLDASVGGDAADQMSLYTSFYAVDGYFIDEVNNSSSYYKSIKSRAGSKTVILNPGTNISHTANIVINFENPLSGAGGSGSFLNYNSNLSSSGVASGAIIYSTSTAASMRQCVDRAIAAGYDWIYVSNDKEPNPFDGVPSYWQEEIDYIAAKNLPPLPAAVPSALFKMSVPTGSAAAGWTLSFPTAARRTYTVQVSGDLRTWTTATRITSNTPATEIATAAVLTMTVNSPPGLKSCFFRAVDVSP